MSASVRFACNLVTEHELLRRRDGKPFAGYGVARRRRIERDPGEWVDGQLTRQSVTTGTAVNHFDHTTARVVVNSRPRDAVWRDGETGGKRMEQVVHAGTRFDGVGVSLKYDVARMERQTALAGTTEI